MTATTEARTTHPDELAEIRHVIDGRSVDSLSGGTYHSLDPFTGRPWARVADGAADDVDVAVGAARRALHGTWGSLTAPQRGRLLLALADAVDADAERLAVLETRDTGKLLREMRRQIEGLGDWFRYFGGLADKFGGHVIPTANPDFLVYTSQVPVGVVAAIVPWNSPALLLSWKLAPALAAGCTVVVKPSDHSPASAVALAQLALNVGIPDGVVNVITGAGPETGRSLVAHPGVDKIAFTGSTEVGRSIAKSAADHFARLTLELGGKSAQLVFEDADLDAAANGIVAGIFAATGQSCMAGSRLLVDRRVADDLVDRVVARARTIRIGDPSHPQTEMGPLATEAQYRKVLGHFGSARDEGVTIAVGGQPAADLGGWFVEPTVLTDVPRTARAWREEIFGPVLAVMPFDDEDEAVDLANGTEFGLAGSVWTRDIHRAHRVAGRLRAGSIWINAYRTVAPQVPFGGFGASGVGRESGIEAIKSYEETKAIWVELSGRTRDPFVLG